MRRLLIFRHAKAEPAEPGQSDQARALIARGRDDAATIGAYIARHAFSPDRVLVSPATRTRETWASAAGALRQPPDPVFDPRLYAASPQTLLTAVQASPHSAQTVLLIGHNPGLQELALLLVGTGDVETRERLREKFPTAGLAIIDFALDDWSKLHARAGRLERFVGPKTIGKTTK